MSKPRIADYMRIKAYKKTPPHFKWVLLINYNNFICVADRPKITINLKRLE